jgi:2-haloacid dehalogenase
LKGVKVADKGKFGSIKACVFDAYGTLFDVHSAIRKYGKSLGGIANKVSNVWRAKQLEYTWLRSLMQQYADFWQVTEEALEYAFDMFSIKNQKLKSDLMQAYLLLECYPEVPEILRVLKGNGFKLAILSNGSPPMLKAAVKNSDLESSIDAIFSVDTIGVYKPDPRVYQIASDGLFVKPDEIIFQSSNAWDAVGAVAFGFRVAWVNRFGQPFERLPNKPDIEIETLADLPKLLETLIK